MRQGLSRRILNYVTRPGPFLHSAPCDDTGTIQKNVVLRLILFGMAVADHVRRKNPGDGKRHPQMRICSFASKLQKEKEGHNEDASSENRRRVGNPVGRRVR